MLFQIKSENYPFYLFLSETLVYRAHYLGTMHIPSVLSCLWLADHRHRYYFTSNGHINFHQMLWAGLL